MIGMQLLCKNLYKDITRNLMCIRDNDYEGHDD